MAGESKPSLEEIFRGWDEKLGPFDPSKLERLPEFAPEKPRPIPAEMANGPHERSIKGGIVGTVIVALALCLLSCTGLNRTMGYYIIGMAYSGWAGLALLLAAGVFTIYHYAMIGLFRYVRDGELLVARVLRIEAWTGGYKNLYFGYTILTEFLSPETGERAQMSINTGTQGERQSYQHYELKLKPGDYVHLVHLPRKKLEKTLRVYGLLGLNPEANLLWRNGKPHVKNTAVQVVGVFALFMGLALTGLAAYYSISYYAPIHPNGGFYGSSMLCAFIFGVVGGFGAVAAMTLAVKTPTERLAGLAILGFMACGTLGFLVPAALNAGLDRSAPTYRAVEIHNYWERSWAMMRSFDLEYSVAKSAEKEWYPSTPDHMRNFPDSDMAAMETHAGFFGWPWIRQVHPVMLLKASPEQGRQVAKIDNEPETGSFRPVVVSHLDQGFFPLTPADEEWVWHKLEEKGSVELIKLGAPGT